MQGIVPAIGVLIACDVTLRRHLRRLAPDTPRAAGVLVCVLMGAVSASAQQSILRQDFLLANTVAVGDKSIQPLPTLTDVLRIIGARTVSSGDGTMRPTVLDNDGDVLRDTNTSVSTAGAWTWGAAGSFGSTLSVTGAATLSSTLGVTGATTLGAGLSVTGNVIGSTGTLLIASPTRISTTAPSLLLSENDQGLDEKNWELRADNDTVTLRLVNDTFGTTSDIFNLTRVGMLPGDWRWGQNLRTVRGQNHAVTDIGTPTVRYNGLYVNELFATTLVIDEKIVRSGGMQIIGEASTLTRTLLSSSTEIYVKHNGFRLGDFGLLQNWPQNEKIVFASSYTECAVVGNCSPTGPDYKYTIQRAFDGTPANDWIIGDVVFNEGQPGDPFMEFIATRSSQGAGHVGQVVIDGPVAYWRMNEAPAGSTPDLMGNVGAQAEVGTQTNGLGVLSFAIGDATTIFDPVWQNSTASGSLVTPNHALLQITGDLTLELYAYRGAATGTDNLLSKWHLGEFHLQVDSAGSMQFCHGNGATFTCVNSAAAYVPVAGDYHLYTVVRDAVSSPDRILFYRDGVLHSSTTINQAIAISSSAVAIGANATSSGNEWEGNIDEVAIYNYALSPDRIASHFAARKSNQISRFTRGPTAIGWVRTGFGVWDLANRWACGNLAGTDYSSNSAVALYGCGFGDVNNTWSRVDSTSFRIMQGATTRLQADSTGILIGPDASTGLVNVFISSSGNISLRDGGVDKITLDGSTGNAALTGDLTIGTNGIFRSAGATALDTGTGLYMAGGATPVFRVGIPSGNRLRWDGSTLELKSNTVTINSLGIVVASSGGLIWDENEAYAFDYGDGTEVGLSAFGDSIARILELKVSRDSGRTALRLLSENQSVGSSEILMDSNLTGAPGSQRIEITTGTLAFLGGTFGMALSGNFSINGNNGFNGICSAASFTVTKGIITSC